MKTRTLLIFVASLALYVTAAFASTVQDVVNNVSYTSYRSYLGYPGDLVNPLFTQAGDSRYYLNPGGQHDAARTNIFNHFNGLGLTTSLSSFTYNSLNYSNVVAVKTGMTRPNDIYILGAHYDSVECPGADDNASGVAGIMEAARVMSSFDFEATIQFVAFDLEELGLCGSAAYASAAKSNGDNILGMISLDMIAFNTGGNNIAHIYGNTPSDPVKNALASAVNTYSGGVSALVFGADNASDHYSFEQQGYQAALFIEDWAGNTSYHQITDNVDVPGFIDYTYATSMTKGVVGYAATAAALVPEPGMIDMLLLGGVLVIYLVVRSKKVRHPDLREKSKP